MARRRRSSRRPRSANAPLILVALVIAMLLLGIWLMQRPGFRPAPPPTAPVSNGQLRIATWNLRKFSERARPDLVVIADIITSSQFDLVAIQEVQQQGQAVQRLRRQLNEPWRHTISEPAGNAERYAFLYRADKLELLAPPALVQSPTALSFARRPCIASFRSAQFDFTLLTVHLWYGDAGANDRRRQEVSSLAELAQQIVASSPEKDLIVLGDFNEFRRTNYLEHFEARGWRRLVQEATNLSSTEPYDSILIDPRHTREFAGPAGVVRFDETRYTDDRTASDEVSDHRPVYADFRSDLPDDD